MEAVQTYCENLVSELVAWKAKVHDVVARFDSVASGDKEKVVDEVRDLHMLVEEIDNRLDGLRRECPTVWEPGNIEMEAKLSEKYIY